MTAALATLSAALFGTADFLGGLASRRHRALIVTVRSQMVGFVVMFVAAIAVPAIVGVRDVGLGVFAGISGGIGVVSLYAGLATGRMGVVAPITAALSGTLPALFDLVRGTRVGATGIAGIVLALVSVVIVSLTGHQPGETDTSRRALVFAVISGVGFSGSLISYANTAHTSGFWPLVVGRTTTIVMLGVVALVRIGNFKLDQTALRPAIGAGIFDGFANIAVIMAMRSGPLAIASVLAALYPVATVLLARYVLDERLHVWQQVGVVLALIAVVLSAIG
jgi:drug/metabolite transporter (DMT)-like permease